MKNMEEKGKLAQGSFGYLHFTATSRRLIDLLGCYVYFLQGRECCRVRCASETRNIKRIGDRIAGSAAYRVIGEIAILSVESAINTVRFHVAGT
jgi:hypothetical protein